MANELKVTIGCSYTSGRLKEQFGLPVNTQTVPRRASDGSKYLETIFFASGVDQSTQAFDAGVVTAASSILTLDTYNNAKISTNGWLFLYNLESKPSGDYIEWGPKVTYQSSNAITMTGPEGASADLTSNNGDSVLVPVGRIEPGESAAMRLVPSGLSFAMTAGSGLATIAATGTPSAKVKYTIFAD